MRLQVALTNEWKRKRAAEAVESRLKSAIDQTDEIILVADAEQRIQYLNQAYSAKTGRDVSDLIGMHVSAAVTHDVTGTDPFVETIANSHVWKGELRLKASDPASDCLVESTVAGVANSYGEVVGTVACCRDRSYEKALESESSRSERMRALGTLSAGIAHDFNNCLTPILSATELLLMESKQPTSRDLAQSAIKAATQARDLIEEILVFGESRTSKLKPLNLSNLLNDIWPLLVESLGENVGLELNAGECSVFVMGDDGQLRSAIQNLVKNAQQAIASQDGTILIELTCIGEAGADELVQLSVEDSGCGIDDTTAKRIFDPYYTTKRSGQGTGLGLASVFAIIESHNGSIRVESDMAVGSRFVVTLPRLAPVGGKPSIVNDPGIPKGDDELILFVDDDPLILMTQTALLKHLNYQVISCGTVAAAVSEFSKRADDINLILSDYALPDGTAADVVGACRGLKPAVSALVLTGNPIGLEGLNCRVLAKPATVAQLAQAIHQVLHPRTGVGVSEQNRIPMTGPRQATQKIDANEISDNSG